MDLAWRSKVEVSEPSGSRPGASRSLLSRSRTATVRGAATATACLDPYGSPSSVHSQAQEMSYPQPPGPLPQKLGAGEQTRPAASPSPLPQLLGEGPERGQATAFRILCLISINPGQRGGGCLQTG